jgi:hypothetical protein
VDSGARTVNDPAAGGARAVSAGETATRDELFVLHGTRDHANGGEGNGGRWQLTSGRVPRERLRLPGGQPSAGGERGTARDASDAEEPSPSRPPRPSALVSLSAPSVKYAH